MYNRFKFCSFALLLSFLLISCSSPDTTQTSDTEAVVEPTTAIETESSPTATNAETAERVVALTSLSADIIQRLDESKLVGIPGSSLFAEDETLHRFTPQYLRDALLLI